MPGYRAAMREWQGAYYEAVGAPCGLLDGIFKLANVMIRTVADKLGVSPLVNAVAAAIKAFLERQAPVDPLLERPSEDGYDDTDGHGF